MENTKLENHGVTLTKAHIIRMAREAFLPYDYETGLPLYIPQLERFATLVVAAEREACAELCEQMDHDGVMIAADCAEAIRARGNT